jgi:hypothetical protein
MAGKKQTLEQAILNAVLRNTAYTSPTTVYAALFTSAPTDTAGGTECADAGYARLPVTFGAPSGSPSACANSGQLDFGIAQSSYTVVAVAICDALTSGAQLYTVAVTSKAIAAGDRYQIPAGSLTVSED